MREIPKFPMPEFLQGITPAKRVLPRAIVQRATVSASISGSGVLTNIPANSPVMEWNDVGFKGLRVDRAATNIVPTSNPSWAFTNRYGILQGSESAITPNGTSVLTYRETPNEQTYNDHVLDVGIGYTDSASSVRTYSFTIKCLINNKDRGFGLRLTTSAGIATGYAFFKDDLSLDRVMIEGIAESSHYKDLGNGWYRIWVRINTPCTVNSIRMAINSTKYGGQWTDIDYNLRFFLADIMIERSLIYSMPILNNGSQNTKAADNIYVDVGESPEHCLFIESDSWENYAQGYTGCLYSTLIAANHISMALYNGNGVLGGTVTTNAIASVGTAQPIEKNSRHKQAISYSEITGALKMYHNGVKTVDTVIAKGLRINRVGIGSSLNGQQSFAGYVRAVGYWKEFFSDQQLEFLTK